MNPSKRLRIARVEVERWKAAVGDETLADQIRRNIDELVGYWDFDGPRPVFVWPPELGVNRPRDRKREVA